jgi:hypothetical protein
MPRRAERIAEIETAVLATAARGRAPARECELQASGERALRVTPRVTQMIHDEENCSRAPEARAESVAAAREPHSARIKSRTRWPTEPCYRTKKTPRGHS